MKKIALVAAIAALGLGGCASTENYKLYAQTQTNIANARAQAEIARYKALEEIADSDDGSRIAAVVAMNMQGSGGQFDISSIAQPKSWDEKALDWVRALLPGATTAYNVYSRTNLQEHMSDNNLELSKNNNRTEVDMGRLIADQEIPIRPGDGDYVAPVDPVVTDDGVVMQDGWNFVPVETTTDATTN
jgi:hypothetical protein